MTTNLRDTSDNDSTIANFLRIGLLSLLFWLPLPLGSNRGWSGSLFVMVIAVLCLVHAISLFRDGTRKKHSPNTAKRPVGSIMIGLLALTQAWVLCQWLFGLSADGGETFRHLMLGTGYAMLFWLITELFDSRRHLTALLTVLVVSGTFQAFFGAFMTLSGIEWLLFGPKEYGRGVVTGTFVNRNHLAGYLEITIACGVGLMLASRSRSPHSWRQLVAALLAPKTRIRIALAIMVIALVMSRSRMGNTAFFASLLISGILFILAHREHRLRNSLILASLVVIDVLIISQYFGLENLKNRLIETQMEDKVVAGEVVQRENVSRDDVAIYVLPMLRERPWTGFGAGSFEAAFPPYPGPDIRGHYDHAHNDMLQFVVEFGLIGAIPLALFGVLALIQALKALWNKRSFYRSGVGLGATMGITAIAIHSTSDFNLQIPANAATFVSLCAVAVLVGKTGTHPRRRTLPRANDPSPQERTLCANQPHTIHHPCH